MKFVRIKYREDNKTEDVIVNLSKIPYIDRTFLNKLNPNLTYDTLFSAPWGGFYRLKFNNKADADNYFNYVMEKLRAVEMKNKP
ncbi:hypothetical protein ARAF_2630 [Arsenophonus endosymbiont of Aleurodicus floccissimus]|uniref:hypothetical protein n=1 Tax=Arsenophonus endosymbiont of Aleurodicus floccissimus TaxID=2152761 RepID=UPI000E6B064C|nr:hypothetical protein [Arsenophonus endosymbiont of Aleurodicus floccissimus]SPP32465.1 hypothetical protein ARAF_2630 [Arsenophonus endosymbiont of Aleurodicus floccissimus]